MSENRQSKVDASIMKDISFAVGDATKSEPEIWVTGLNGESFKKNKISHTRFQELVQEIGEKVHEQLTNSLEQMANLASDIAAMGTNEEKALATYIVRCCAWTFVKESGIPLFLFSPKDIPEEMLIEANSTIEESFVKSSGRRGFVPTKTGGKKSYSRKNDRRPKKL